MAQTRGLTSGSPAMGAPCRGRLSSGRPRAQSPARAASPARRAPVAPVKASHCPTKNTFRTPSRPQSLPRHHALAPVPSTAVAFSSSTSLDTSVATLRRSQRPSQQRDFSRSHVSRPVNSSVKFPGATEEDSAVEAPTATLDDRGEGGIEEDAGSGVQVKSSLDRIELQAKESLSKLKHLLHKLKTRKEGEVRSSLVTSPSGQVGQEATIVGEEQKIYVSQKIEVDLSKPVEASSTSVDDAELDVEVVGDEEMKGLDLAELKNGLEMQLDAVTATRAVVTFDDTTQTAVVTVTATVRAAEIADKKSYSEQAIALAAKALARTCLELDEKAQASALSALSLGTGSSSSSSSAASPLTSPLATSPKVYHEKTQRALLSGTVVSWELAGEEYGCTPFRPVYLVKLQMLDGSHVEAIYKPCRPGDKFLRWRRAPEDWVAYQLSCLLGMDVVPPAVMRSSVQLGEKLFDLGVMVYKPSNMLPLENTDPAAVAYPGEARPETIVSDVRILDTLLGSAVRQRYAFQAAVSHWSEAAPSEGIPRFYPVAMSHAMGPCLGGALHSMWTSASPSSAAAPAVKVISRLTMAKLKGLSRSLLLEAFSGVLNVEEIETMLSKRDHLLAYFEGRARKAGWANVCI